MSAQVNITQLPAAGAITGTEAVPVVQNGVTVQTTTGAIAAAPSQVYTYLTVSQTPQLPNSRYFGATNGLSVTDGGAQGVFNITTTGALSALVSSGTGFQVKTSSTAITGRSVAVSGSGLSITNGDGIAGDPTTSLTGQVLNLANLSANGLMTITSAGALSSTQIAAVGNQTVVTNANGIAGSPTIGLADNPIIPGTGAIQIPAGTTGQQPAGVNGKIRYNSTDGAYEGFSAGSWRQFTLGGTAVTSISTGTGLTGGPITSAGTISIANTTVTAAAYGSASQVAAFTVNAQGQLTAASSVTINISASQITSGVIGIGLGGTGATTQQGAINALAGAVTSGLYLRGNGTNVTLSAIQAADVPTLNQNTTGSAGSLSGIVAVGNGGTGQTSYTDGQLLIGNSGTGSLVKANLNAGTGISITNGSGTITIAATGGTSVTSVTGTAPVVSSGGTTPAISLAASYGDTQNPYASKTANFVLAAPNGSAGVPTFRAIVAADIPTLNQNTTGTAANVTGTVAVGNGGTGQTTYTNGQLLIGNSTGNTLTKATLTQGTGISITNGTGSITISATGGGGVTTFSAGSTGFSPSTGVSGAVTLSGTLGIFNGGTGLAVSTSNGQLLIGNGTGYTLSTLTAGANVTITNASGSITIASSGGGGGITWTPNTTMGGSMSVPAPAGATTSGGIVVVVVASASAASGFSFNVSAGGVFSSAPGGGSYSQIYYASTTPSFGSTITVTCSGYFDYAMAYAYVIPSGFSISANNNSTSTTSTSLSSPGGPNNPVIIAVSPSSSLNLSTTATTASSGGPTWAAGSGYLHPSTSNLSASVMLGTGSWTSTATISVASNPSFVNWYVAGITS